MDDFFIDLNDAAQGVGVGEVSESSMSGKEITHPTLFQRKLQSTYIVKKEQDDQ